METTHTAPIASKRPSATRAFFSGFGSGAISGALMTGIVALLSLPFGGGIGLLSAGIMVAATGIFGGLMSAKRALFDAPAHAPLSPTVFVPTVVPAIVAPSIAQAVAPVVSLPDIAPESLAPTRSWAAHTGRADNRIEHILTNGAMSDKDRASAILAERQAASLAEPRRA
jgi:hypothetical protein